MEKICWQITVAAFMQPLQDDFRDPAAKDNSITCIHLAALRYYKKKIALTRESYLHEKVTETRNFLKKVE